ncbi:hypothetical protein [Aquimarina pacifica]|uniref:hypothetical protein n=1 Tax=Aquimarina pacifica TaxID=1296415 RepID=UPI0012683E3F|nr:hypothetical protein [Aquimarina pacifica]
MNHSIEFGVRNSQSYYLNLMAQQIKIILRRSGTTYNIDVEIKQEDGTKKRVPFLELSKFGEIETT